MKKHVGFFYTILVLLSFVPFAAWMSFEKSIIIYIGAVKFRTGRNAFFALAIVASLSIALRFAKAFERKEKPPEINTDALLDLKELDKPGLKDELRLMVSGKWPNLKRIDKLYEIMENTDLYQENLEKLLLQSDYLGDKPAELMERLEDSMYMNIKKLLNYMMILQPRDMGILQEKVDECAEKNGGLLQKATDFIVAVTEYVNDGLGDGGAEKSLDKINSYMFVVLDAIEGPGVYLT